MRYTLECATSPVGTAPANMSDAYVGASQCIWAEASSFPPNLSTTDTAQICGAITVLFAVAYIAKRIRVMLERG